MSRKYDKKLNFILTKSQDEIEDVYNYDVEVFTDSPDFEWSLSSLKEEMQSGWQIFSARLNEEIVAVAFLKEKDSSLLTKNTPIKMVYQGNGFSHQIKEFFEGEAKTRKIKELKHYCSSHNFRMISLNENHGYFRTPRAFDGNKYLTEWRKIL